MFRYIFRRTSLGFCALYFFALSAAVFAQHPNHERGLNAHSYLSGNFDHVNLYNGNLTLTIPIASGKVGGALDYNLTLVYNSTAWSFKTENQPNYGERTQAEPNRKSNAGMGWMLSLGAIYAPDTPWYNDDKDNYLYVAPDGSEHFFNSQLYPQGGQTSRFFTNDGTYLRMRAEGGGFKIEFPDGLVHTFTASAPKIYLLSKMEDRFGNVLDVDTTQAGKWTLKEKCQGCATYTRQHVIEFSGGNVSSVKLNMTPGTGVSATEYAFTYTSQSIQRHNKDTWVRDPGTTQIPATFLTSLKLPADAGFYNFEYSTNNSVTTGMILSATLPTRGHYKWNYTPYQRWVKPVDLNAPVCVDPNPCPLPALSSNEGVWYKEIYNKPGDSTPIGKFEYILHEITPTTSDRLGQSSVTVRSPIGDDTVNYFSLSFDETDYQDWAYSLPLTQNQSITRTIGGQTRTLYLSQEIYNGHAEDGTKLRSVYVAYDSDPRPNFPDRFNRRLTAQVTVYHDDNDRWSGVFYSDWNGLGKFRTTVTGGNFDGQNKRTNFADYDNTVPLPSAPWILNTYTNETVTENNQTATTSVCYSKLTGYLRWKRTHKGAGNNNQDIFVQYVDGNSDGNVDSEKSHGGDRLANAPAIGCDETTDAGGSPEYQIDHTYNYGIRTHSKFSAADFYTLDTEVDPLTGLVTKSWDASKVLTQYDYDALGRVKNVYKVSDADVVYTYTTAAGSSLAKLAIERKNSGGTILSGTYLTYDNFGRLTRETELLPGEVQGTALSTRETKYNALGWKISVSEPGNLAKQTTYTNYDPFGRAGKITAPDGLVTDYDYTGVSVVKRTQRIGTSYSATTGLVDKSSVTTAEYYDRQGRLSAVQEGSGPSNAPRVTSYQYDVGNRLSRVAIKYEGGGTEPERVNFAAATSEATVAASSTVNGNYPALSAINGERKGAGWGTPTGGWNDASQAVYGTDAVVLYFNQTRSLSEIDVITLRDGFATKTTEPDLNETFQTAENTGNGIVDFDVQYQNGQGWVTIDCGDAVNPCGRVTGNNKVWRRFNFSPVNTSAIRVVIHKGVVWHPSANNYSRIVELEAWGPAASGSEQVWVEDGLPAGADAAGTNWHWIGSNPSAYSANFSHQTHPWEGNAGLHQHYFLNATQTLAVNPGEKLYTYVYLDPADPPSQIMLQWYEAGSWEHRAYWGADQIPWGVNGTNSRRYMGALPAAGQWVRLEVPASQVGLEGKTCSGMAFTVFDGQATWDRSGKTAAAAGTQVNFARDTQTSVVASSTFSSNYPVSAVVDGDRKGQNWGNGGYGSGWADASEKVYGSDILQINFKDNVARTIDEINVYTLRDGYSTKTDEPSLSETFNTAPNTGQGIRYFEVQYWNGSRWLTVDCGTPTSPCGLVKNNNRVWRQIKFSPITTYAIRVIVRDGALWTSIGNNYSRIVEVEAYGPGSSSPGGVEQVRTFSYDNRGFLFSETHPEITGAVTFKYDSAGNMTGKAEGNNSLEYKYDSAGRLYEIKDLNKSLTLKTFSFYHENAEGEYRLGKLKSASRVNRVTNPYVTSGSTLDVKVTEEYQYVNQEGRLSSRRLWLNDNRGLPGGPEPYKFNQTFTYDPLGNLKTQGYPQCEHATCTQSNAAKPKTITYDYGNGHLIKVSRDGTVNYASSISYHPNRTINQVAHGNGVLDTNSLDPYYMQRPSEIKFTKGTTTPLWSTGTYEYDGAGNVVRMGSDWFIYDHANRIKEGTAGVGGSVRRKQSYTYDAMGNVLTFTTTNELQSWTDTLLTDPATNRWSGTAPVIYYDSAGNALGANSTTQFKYDAINMMTSTTTHTYLYGPSDERVWTINATVAGNFVETISLRGLGNEVLREYEIRKTAPNTDDGNRVGNWIWAKDMIYRGTAPLSTETPAGKREFHLDHLGSTRLMTNSSGSQYGDVQYYYPYGNQATAQEPDKFLFTGHERDFGENPHFDLDYMHARYYINARMRFMTVDPGRDFDPKRPQSWNRYSYVRGNPINATDPTGREGEGQQVNFYTPTDGVTAAEMDEAIRQLRESQLLSLQPRENSLRAAPKREVRHVRKQQDDNEGLEFGIRITVDMEGVKQELGKLSPLMDILNFGPLLRKAIPYKPGPVLKPGECDYGMRERQRRAEYDDMIGFMGSAFRGVLQRSIIQRFVPPIKPHETMNNWD